MNRRLFRLGEKVNSELADVQRGTNRSSLKPSRNDLKEVAHRLGITVSDASRAISEYNWGHTAGELVRVAKMLTAEVVDMKEIEPVESDPVKTRKTQKGSVRIAVTVPGEVLRSVETMRNLFDAKTRMLNELGEAIAAGEMGEAANVFNRNRWMKDELPDKVVQFIETAGKKMPVTGSWKRGVLRDMEEILTEGEGADSVEYEAFLTMTDDTHNKFHYFAVFRYKKPDGEIVYVGGNAYGRIGKRSRVMVIARGPSPHGVIRAVQQKEHDKERKGYE